MSSKEFEAALEEVRLLVQERDEEPPHVEHVSNLALQIFDQTQTLHGFHEVERWMLHAAALLHDIGWAEAVEGRKHHKISARMIRQHPWKRVPKAWITQIACIARYHRRALPRDKHRGFAELSGEDRERVMKLAAILRVADGLDRAHLRRVQRVRTRISSEQVTLMLEGASDLREEIKGATRKADLFEVAYGRALEIEKV